MPDRCLEQIRRSDVVLHAGDFASEGVLDEIEALGTSLHAVHGNVDPPRLRKRLPRELELELGGVRVAMLHDAGPAKGRLERMRSRFPDAQVVVFGHSHLPLQERRPGFQIFNPGSPTERRRAPNHTMGVARLHRGRAELRHLILD